MSRINYDATRADWIVDAAIERAWSCRRWAAGTGADVMKRIAAPMVGGVASAMLLTLLVIPVIYAIWRWHTDVKPRSVRA